MKTNVYFSLLAVLMLLFVGCQQAESTAEPTEEIVEETAPTNDELKAEIQALENSWAEAMNARNLDAIMAFYSDDAISMGNNEPMITGKDAIRANLEKDFATMKEGNSISYTTLEVFGDENLLTEVGTTTVSDPDGAVLRTGKYIAVFERHDGTLHCIRDIWNSDSDKK